MTLRIDIRAFAVRAALVILIAAVVGAAAFVLSERQAERYDTAVRLSYAPGPELQALGLVDPTENKVRMNTEAAALESFDLAVRTSRAVPDLGLAADDVAADVSAVALPDSQVVELRARAGSAQAAVRLLEVYRDQFLDLRRERERDRAREAETALRRRLGELPRSQRTGALGASLRAQLGALEVVRRSGTDVPQPIEAVRRPTAPSAPRVGRNVLFGVLFGLALGIGLVAIRPTRADQRGLAATDPPPQLRPSSAPDAGRSQEASTR
jgi:capsular polysaccharide biosynthesis protein